MDYPLDPRKSPKEAPGTQALPPGLPIKVDDVGNFIAILSNRHSNTLLAEIISTAKRKTPSLPVKGLKLFLGVERWFPHLLRSDHAPFWHDKIPAMMWTDTSEFRNPHYHRRSDTPETLSYDFMLSVVTLLHHALRQQLGLSAYS